MHFCSTWPSDTHLDGNLFRKKLAISAPSCEEQTQEVFRLARNRIHRVFTTRLEGDRNSCCNISISLKTAPQVLDGSMSDSAISQPGLGINEF